jgi:hypothetical protein
MVLPRSGAGVGRGRRAHILRQPSDPNLKGVLAETIAAEAVEAAILTDLLGDV